MKIHLDFEPCPECNSIMAGLCSPEMLLADDETRASESARFLRHLTYNHNEVIKAVADEIPQRRDQEPGFYR